MKRGVRNEEAHRHQAVDLRLGPADPVHPLSLNIPLSDERAQAAPAQAEQDNSSAVSDKVIDSETVTQDLFPDAPMPAPEELTQVRDANTKTYLNPDGSYTCDVYMAPVHWQDSDGNWQEIDSDLVEEKTSDGYDLANASNAWRVRMARDTTKGKQFALEAGDKRMALNLIGYGKTKGGKDEDKTSAPVASPLESAPTSSCEAEKNKASFKVTDLFSLDYIVTGVAVEQLIVLESPEAPNTYSFSLDLSELEVKQDGLGYLRFFDTKEEDWGFITKDEEMQMTASVGFGYLPFIFGDAVDAITIGADFKTWFGYCPTDNATNEPE